MPITTLIQHILEVHRSLYHDELPSLRADVERARGDLFAAFDALYGALREHVWKEDQILFPMVLRRAAGQAVGVDLAGPIRQTFEEHQECARLAEGLRRAVDAAPPDRVAARIGRFLEGLEAVFRLEDEDLFPMMVALEGV